MIGPGLHFDVPEADYHSDPCEAPSLNVSTAQALVLESAAHAYLRHPRLGGKPFEPSKEMDRGTVIHALLLGSGHGRIRVVECDNWKKPDNQKIRDAHRDAGLVPVTRAQYADAVEAANALREKLTKKGYPLDGHSEVTAVWDERASNGAVVRCRGRFDHLQGSEIIDLKITGDASPRFWTRGQITRMGYDIQGTAYVRALEDFDIRERGRAVFTILACEPEPPFCVTPVRFDGSLRELGSRKWLRAVDRWEWCRRTDSWPDYTSEIVIASARPWELEEAEGETAA
jgi:hypothetical protein